MNDELSKVVTGVLRAEARLPSDFTVTAQTPMTDGGLDLTSLGLVRALVAIEDRLGIQIDDAKLLATEFRTVDDLLALVIQAAAP
jgi:acyl carrier protein